MSIHSILLDGFASRKSEVCFGSPVLCSDLYLSELIGGITANRKGNDLARFYSKPLNDFDTIAAHIPP